MPKDTQSIQIEITQNDIQLDARWTLLRRMFRFTLLIFRDSPVDDGRVSKPKLALSIIWLLTATYNTGFILYFSSRQGTENLANILLACCWSFQCLISMYFIVHWQFGHMQALFCAETWSALGQRPLKSAHMRRQLRKIYVIFSVLFFCIFGSAIFLNFNYYYGDLGSYRMNKGLYEGFGGSGTGSIGIIISSCSSYVWLLVFLFYLLVLLRVLQELETFNERLKEVGSKGSDDEDITDELLKLYDHQINLTTLIRQVNSTFEVYTFLMVGSIIPIMIFSLLNCAQNFKHSTDLKAFFYLPEVAVCFLELLGLTMTPAKIYVEIRSIEANLLANKRIWIPHNERNYQIGTIFIANVNQDGLGVTLWGFALMTKSLILTTASLILTYLTLIIQMDKSEDPHFKSATTPNNIRF